MCSECILQKIKLNYRTKHTEIVGIEYRIEEYHHS